MNPEKLCNVCRQQIRGLDYSGRCEDCFADAQQRITTNQQIAMRDRAAIGRYTAKDPREKK